jgi:hypothetical protein
MSRLQKKPPANKRGHPTLQNMNFFYFCGSFLPSWIRIRIQITDPDPDPMVRLNTDPDTDPDPKPWFFLHMMLKFYVSAIRLPSFQCCGAGSRMIRKTGTELLAGAVIVNYGYGFGSLP